MQIITKKYDEQRTYLEYNDDGKIFTNAGYFMFDIGSGTFEDCLKCGGFFANMTWRYIKEKNLDTVKYIMLCSIPQKNAFYKCNFVYLDQDLNIQNRIEDNNFYDYNAFHNKFKDLIVREGFVYELEDTESLKEITEQLCYSPTTDFGFAVYGKQIQFGDIIVYRNIDLSIFKEKLRNNLKRVNAKDMVLQLDTDVLSTESFNFSCKMLDENGNTIKKYQAKAGFTNIGEYAESIYQEREEDILEDYKTKEEWRKEWESQHNQDFEFSLPFEYVRSNVDHLSFLW